MNEHGIVAVWAWAECVCATCGGKALHIVKAGVLPDGRIGGVVLEVEDSGGQECKRCRDARQAAERKAHADQRRRRAWARGQARMIKVKGTRP